MSDQIAEQEIRRRLVIFLRIPNETWTDVFKMFPRRTLVQNIAPACKRFKNICNRNVTTIHVIKKADQFNEKLERGDPEANQQLEHLAGNDCQLDSQFRLTRIDIIQANKVILRHCIELFRGCQLSFAPISNEALIAECLTRLEAAKPIAITIKVYGSEMLDQLVRHPTTWECNRVRLFIQYRGADMMPIAVTFLDWLHHQQQQQPIGVVDDNSGDGDQEVRCLIIQCSILRPEVANWLLNGCIQNLQQSQGSKDRRRFAICFFDLVCREVITLLDQFERHHNQETGELLLLERDDQFNTVYRLRRCLVAEEAANGNDEFYGKIFERDRPQFVVNEDDGPMVEIGN